MRRDELTELHYIAPFENIHSILGRGLLSQHGVAQYRPRSIAKPDVQAMRAAVRVPGGRPLHDYVNCYVCARNPMLFKWRGIHREICVLCILPAIIDTPGSITTDQNAASGYARFAPLPDGLLIVDKDMVFADDWRHPCDPRAFYRHRSIKCAEVLVPERIAPNMIVGAYVSCESARATLAALAPQLPIKVDAHFFFVG